MSDNDVATHGFAIAVLAKFKGKMVEINTGEVKTTHVLDQFSHDIKHLIRGKVVGAMGDALIIECPLRPGVVKTVLINCWSISAITDLDVSCSLSEVYWDADKKFVNK